MTSYDDATENSIDTADHDPRDVIERVADDTTMIPSRNLDFHAACGAADCVRVTLRRCAEDSDDQDPDAGAATVVA